MSRLARFIVTCLMCFGQANTVLADEGITDQSVRFAQVAVLEGPSGTVGQRMKQGILAAFEQINAKGGVHGRRLFLDSVNDGYEPDQSSRHVIRIIQNDRHIALIGMIGTPTSQATQPIATRAKIPYIGPFTGASFLRDPALTNVFNVRASYLAETEALIAHLVDKRGLMKIGVLFQDDGFGRDGLQGVKAALQRRDMTAAAEGHYPRNTVAVKTALLDIRRANPDAIVMIGTSSPIAEFVRLSKNLNLIPTFASLSFGSNVLVTELGETGEGIIISQVVPSPYNRALQVVVDYQNALDALNPDQIYDFVSFEGYIVGRLAIAGLNDAGADLSRAKYLNALGRLHMLDLGGINMTFGPADNQGLDEIFLSQIGADGEVTQIAN